VYSIQPGGCKEVEPDKYFSPPLYKDYKTKLPLDKYPKKLPHYLESSPSSFLGECHQKSVQMIPFSSAVADNVTQLYNLRGNGFHSWKFAVRKDGSIIYKDYKQHCVVHKEHICVDGIHNFGAQGKEYTNSEDEMIIFLCVSPNPSSVC